MRRALLFVGLVITATYTAVLGYFVMPNASSLGALPLNELGDFLAGAFGPLALFWLILGFVQQGIELKQNTKALELQAVELRNSVQQQEALVNVTREQAQAQIAAFKHEQELLRKEQLPLFVIERSGAIHNSLRSRHSFYLKNVGNHVTDVQVSTNLEVNELQPDRFESFMRGDSQRIEMEIEPESRVPSDPELSITYTNSFGVVGSARFSITFKSEGQYLALQFARDPS